MVKLDSDTDFKQKCIEKIGSFFIKCHKDIPKDINNVEKIAVKLNHRNYDPDPFYTFSIPSFKDLFDDYMKIDSEVQSHMTALETPYADIFKKILSTEKIAFIIGAAADIHFIPLVSHLDDAEKKGIVMKNIMKKDTAIGCLLFPCGKINEKIGNFIDRYDSYVFSTNWSRNIECKKTTINYIVNNEIEYDNNTRTLQVYFGGGNPHGNTIMETYKNQILKVKTIVFIGTSIPEGTFIGNIFQFIEKNIEISERRPVIIYIQNSLRNMKRDEAIPFVFSNWGNFIMFFHNIETFFN